MAKKESKLDKACKQTERALERVNTEIENLGVSAASLYDEIGQMQSLFAQIRNIPEKERLEFEKIERIRLDWKSQAQKIEKDFDTAQVKQAGKGVAGTGAGIAVAALGPTAAMGIATTFGVASTGVAISTLNGAAATSAALAWLGGGALAAGGGGMAAGNALLALAGPIGWAIAGVSLLGSGAFLLKSRNDKKRIESIFTLISVRDTKSYELAIVELNERIIRIEKEKLVIKAAVERIMEFGLDYKLMTEAQQYELGSYVNLMQASVQLLVNPISGLLPKYTEADFEKYEQSDYCPELTDKKKHPLVVSLCNLLYKIELSEKDRELLRKTLRKNKEFLKELGLKKADFDAVIMETVAQALWYLDYEKYPDYHN